MTTATEGELAAARRLYDPTDHGGLSFDEFCEAAPDELDKLVQEAKLRADAVREDLDHLEAPSTDPGVETPTAKEAQAAEKKLD